MWIRYLNSSRIRYVAWRQGQELISPRQSVAEAQNAARAGHIVVEIAIGLPLASKPNVLSARCAPARRVRGFDGSMKGACTRLAVPRAAALDG